MKYIEVGFGNKWLVRTETEFEDGTEFEEKGVKRPIKLKSFYFRLWIGHTVFILDSKEGFKKSRKDRKEFKVLFGIRSI